MIETIFSAYLLLLLCAGLAYVLSLLLRSEFGERYIFPVARMLPWIPVAALGIFWCLCVLLYPMGIVIIGIINPDLTFLERIKVISVGSAIQIVWTCGFYSYAMRKG